MSLLFPLTWWCCDSGDCIVMRNCSSPSSSFVGVSTAAAVAVETVDSGETVIDDGEVKEQLLLLQHLRRQISTVQHEEIDGHLVQSGLDGRRALVHVQLHLPVAALRVVGRRQLGA
ncbi:hypothetical protein TYRP_015238 [Tyrophagus putrescentiae]|nr:hypothetical protein TYRP_015238 [Tyrophagus putrescentiae]